jgi:hypothetical protein
MDYYDESDMGDELSDINWDHAEEDLIPIDRSHMSQEVHDARTRADQQEENNLNRINDAIQQLEEEDAINSQNDVEDQDNDGEQVIPQSIENFDQGVVDEDADSDERYWTTEMGLTQLNEAGVESPERIVYNNLTDLQEDDSESSNPEQL